MGDDAAEPTPANEAGGSIQAPIDQLNRNPDQPRKIFSETEIDELSASIRDRGVLQPILVRPMPGGAGGWQIIAGERRWRAAQKAGLKVVPILVRDMTDAEVLEVGVIENVQRQDLNPIEEAAAYALLMADFGHTQDSLAGVVGKSRSHVANTLRLMNLSDAVRDHLVAGRLTAGHARALLNAPNADALAEKVIAEGLNVRQVEALARKAVQGGPDKTPGARAGAATTDADTQALEHDLADALGLKVRISDKGGKGEVILAYGTLEQLDDLCRRLMR